MTDSTKVVNLQQLKDHIDGIGNLNHHKASSIDLNPPLIVLGEEFNNVQSIIEKLKSVAFPFVPDATENTKGILKLAGDLRGNSIDLVDAANQENVTIPRVRGIQGYSVANIRPADGHVLTWDEEYGWWEPKPSLTASNLDYATPYKYGIVRLSDGHYPGDIGGTAGNLRVENLQSYPLSLGGEDNPVYPDQYLKWDGLKWTNSYLPLATSDQFGIIKIGGDISGTADNLQVTGINGQSVNISCANNGDTIVYNEEQNAWTCGFPNIGFSLTEDATYGSQGGVKVIGLDNRPILHQAEVNNNEVLTYFNGHWQSLPLACASSTERGAVKLTNDFGGTCEFPLVVGFYNQPLDPATMPQPLNRQIIQYFSYNNNVNNYLPNLKFDLEDSYGMWKAVDIDSAILISGDLSGNTLSQKCIGWSGNPLDASFEAPLEGDVPIYNGSKWVLRNQFNDLLGNPEIRTFTNYEGVRNTYIKYQLSTISRGNSNGLFLDYSIPDNSSIIMQGKIIARMVNDDYVDEDNIVYPQYSGLNQSNPVDQKLKFDLEDLPANSYYYDLNAGFESTTVVDPDSIGILRYVDSNDPFINVSLVAKYPTTGAEIIPPSVSFASPRNFVINSGSYGGAVIHWTLYLEIFENGV